MVSWLSFGNILFGVSILGFLINFESFFKILIFSEITGISLYCYTVLTGVSNNDITLITNSFFILGLASLEFSIGLLLLIVFKNNMKSIDLNEDKINDKNSFISKKKNYVNRFYGKSI